MSRRAAVGRRLESAERGSGISIARRMEEPLLPEEFLAAAEDGIREATLSGVVGGYPVVDIKVWMTGGSCRDGDSTALGYRIAAASAFRDGCQAADPVLLEPIMMVDIITPGEFIGEVIGDINARKGEIQAVMAKGAVSEIRARVPLRALFGYSTDLRSATQGRAVFSMQFLAYDRN